MKTTHSQIVLQASIVVLLAVVSPSIGDTAHLEKWLNSPATNKILIQVDSHLNDAYTVHHPSRNIPVDMYSQNDHIVAAKTTDNSRKNLGDLNIHIENSKQRANFDQRIYSRTIFLPFAENRATLILLDHRQASWFATTQVCGCDVWVAMANHEHAEPLVIHINANRLENSPVQNLQYKQQLAEAALNIFNSRHHRGPYEFQLRISYDYAKKHPNLKNAIDGYWNTYKGTHFIYSDPSFFYGMYNAVQNTWNFKLKDIIDGKIVYGTVCDDDTSTCTCIISKRL